MIETQQLQLNVIKNPNHYINKKFRYILKEYRLKIHTTMININIIIFNEILYIEYKLIIFLELPIFLIKDKNNSRISILLNYKQSADISDDVTN